LDVVTEKAVRMADSKQNAQLLRRRLVRGTTRSPQAAEQREALVETVVMSRTNPEDKMVRVC